MLDRNVITATVRDLFQHFKMVDITIDEVSNTPRVRATCPISGNKTMHLGGGYPDLLTMTFYLHNLNNIKLGWNVTFQELQTLITGLYEMNLLAEPSTN